MRYLPIILLFLFLLAIPVYADPEIQVVGDGSIKITFTNETFKVYVKSFGDQDWVYLGEYNDTATINLPWGKYYLNISWLDNATWKWKVYVIDNAPKILSFSALFYTFILVLLTAVHIWRKGVVSGSLAIIFFIWYSMEFLQVFGIYHGIALFGYIIFVILLIVYRR